MALAFAGFLAGLAALAVPIILHFLKNKPTQRTPFPSLRFLQATLARRAANNRLRKWLILLLRCLCLTALALAFCLPYIPRFSKQPEMATIVLWDRSFSMQAKPNQATLRKQCLKLLNEADASHPMLLGAVSDKVVWSGKFTGNAQELRTAFESLEHGEGTSSFENALRLADARLAVMPGKTKQIVVITDHQALPWKTLQWKEKLSPGIQLSVIAPENGAFINAAITDLSLKSLYKGPGDTATINAQLKNFSDTSLRGILACFLDGKEVARQDVELATRSETTRTFMIKGEKAHQGIEVRLEVDDELTADNHRWLALNATPLPMVCAIAVPSSQTDFLRLAFNPSSESASANWVEWNDDLPPEKIALANLLIIRDGFSLDSQTGEQFLATVKQGGSAVLVWNDTPNMRNLLLQFGIAADLLPKKQTKELDFIDFDHPVFKPFLDAQVGGFFNILFFDPPVLTLPDNAQVLAAFKDGTPAIAEIPVDQGRLLVVATGMERRHTDWPAHATFLPFWREMMVYCEKDQATDLSLQVSATPRYIQGLQQARCMESDEPIAVEQSSLPAEKSGTYLLDPDTNPRVVSINVPREESNPAQLEESFTWEQIMSMEPALASLAPEQPMDQGKSFWHALFIVAILAALGEMLIANRTVL